ncbi:unnamed protein product [Ixodes persulcatus]
MVRKQCLQLVCLAFHSAHAPKVASKWQKMMLQKPECHAVGRRDRGGWAQFWEESTRVHECRRNVQTSGSFPGLSSKTATCSKPVNCHIHRYSATSPGSQPATA